MAKVTSKLQVTIPKAIAEAYGIQAGDTVDFEAGGEVIRLVPESAPAGGARLLGLAERLRLFEESEARLREAQADLEGVTSDLADRGWTREELYTRGEAG